MKPKYKYSSGITEAIRKGESARIFTIDHPIFGSNWVRTSTVIKYNKETGEIETRNSVYECIAG